MNLTGIERVQAILAEEYGLERPIETLIQWGITGDESDNEIYQIYRDWFDEITH